MIGQIWKNRAWAAVLILMAGAASASCWSQTSKNNSPRSDKPSAAASLHPVSAGAPASVPVQKISVDGYLIGPDDVLDIAVWREPEVSRKATVRTDGKITLPLVGDVQAAGITPENLQASITRKLKDYIDEPQVSVIVEQMNSRKFNVMGRVQHPGSFLLTRPTNVLDALAMAGGFSDFAKVTKIYLLRHRNVGFNDVYHFNYKQVVKGHKADQNRELQPGDTVVVP